jgi:hypothetical protein
MIDWNADHTIEVNSIDLVIGCNNVDGGTKSLEKVKKLAHSSPINPSIHSSLATDWLSWSIDA